MKNQLLIKVILVLPIIIFFDWVLMAVFGCVTSLFGLGSNFYCGPFCFIGKGILLVSVVSFVIYLLFPEIKKAINT
jgi:hypothetical protein